MCPEELKSGEEEKRKRMKEEEAEDEEDTFCSVDISKNNHAKPAEGHICTFPAFSGQLSSLLRVTFNMLHRVVNVFRVGLNTTTTTNS